MDQALIAILALFTSYVVVRESMCMIAGLFNVRP